MRTKGMKYTSRLDDVFSSHPSKPIFVFRLVTKVRNRSYRESSVMVSNTGVGKIFSKGGK